MHEIVKEHKGDLRAVKITNLLVMLDKAQETKSITSSQSKSQ